MSALQISISTLEDTNFGDHGAVMRRDHEAMLGETVEDLVRRLFPKLGQKFQSHSASDVIEIRVMVDRFGDVTGESDPGSETPF